MKKINLAISGCLGRMGQQLIKSSKKNKSFKLVTLTENRILNNLWLEPNNKDLIVYYNPDTKEKKLVYETELALWKMYINKEKLYIVTDEWELYKLENIK
mgnify:CR=1 FL=1